MTEETEPVKVFCRLKPSFNENEEPCVFYETKGYMEYIRTVPPIGSRRSAKEVNHLFSEIFTNAKGQNELYEDVSYPMVIDLLEGKNGLLFTYGVTGSGKTYTMQGTEEEPGVVPRALKSLFNRVTLVPLNRVQSDNRNGFIIRGLTDELKNINQPKKQFSNRSSELLSNSYLKKIEDIVSDEERLSNCAVFISLVEIYGKRITDLLSSKMDVQKDITIKEDAKKNKYLHNVTEVEVQSAEEAFALYLKGQNNRKVESTKLNTESSRSHMVFNIRLVRLDGELSYVGSSRDIDHMWSSQLSLIDLAGSERANRSGTIGARLKEAGDINNSLMVLRRCMDRLRDKNKQGVNSKPDYRSSELTHLFKTTLEGGSALRMIVCVQSCPEEYEETMNVLMFADNSQEVSLAVQKAAEPFKKTTELVTNLSREDQILCRLKDISEFVSNRRMIDQNASDLEEIQCVLELMEKCDEAMQFSSEIATLMCNDEAESSAVNDQAGQIELLTSRLARERLLVGQFRKQQAEMKEKLAERDERLVRMEEKVRVLEAQMRGRVEEVRVLEGRLMHKHVQEQEAGQVVPVKAIVRKFEQNADRNLIVQCSSNRFMRKVVQPQVASATVSGSRKGFFNPRFRKSRSQEHCVVHKEKNEIPAGTLYQVQLRGNKRRQTKNPSLEGLRGADQYLLQHQTVDSEAEVQHDYYKGNIIPTASGGVAMALYEVETVTQKGPLTGEKRSHRRRSYSDGDGDFDDDSEHKRLKDDSD